MERASSGIEGLDEILCGGFPTHQVYLVEGDPGTGKTTLGLQFLLAGVARGEPALYIALSETEAEVRDVIQAHGWHTDGLTIMGQPAQDPPGEEPYSFFHPEEVELGNTTREILQECERVRPHRVVFDSLSELRLLAQDPLRYRRQILGLKRYFIEHEVTVLLLDPLHAAGATVETLAHGVLRLEQVLPLYGEHRRRLTVEKMRGIGYHSGFHDFRITTGGIVVYPSLRANSSRGRAVELREHEIFGSGLPRLDELTGGGLDRGTATMLLGPSGVGKSTLAVQYALAAISRGEKVAAFLFDESADNWTLRASRIGGPMQDHIAAGRLLLREISPAQISAGEFACLARDMTTAHDVSLLIIDSINGYYEAMHDERALTCSLHDLFMFLNQQGVLTMLIAAQHGFLGDAVEDPLKLSYLADTVIVLRYFEAFAEVRKAISVLKKRTGKHENTIRELRIGSQGVQVGQQLREFHGVLGGQLVYRGGVEPLLAGGEHPDGG